MAWTPDTEAEWRARYNATQAALRKFGGPLTDGKGMDATNYLDGDMRADRKAFEPEWSNDREWHTTSDRGMA